MYLLTTRSGPSNWLRVLHRNVWNSGVHRSGATKGSPRWMSVRPSDTVSSVSRKKVTIQTLSDLRASRVPITMLTAYDYPTASLLSSCTEVDITLVGDSLAQVCLGYPSTTCLTLDEMIHHCKAVRRGTTHPLLLADLPFGSYQASVEDGVRSAIRLIREGGVEGVKIEGGAEVLECVTRLTKVGIPVMGHVGLLPQRHVALSGYRVQGKTALAAKHLLHTALSLQAAGAFSIVLEAIPAALASYITARLSIPTIGIGAGPGTSGQVLVWDDVIGTWAGHKAKFVRRFSDVKSEAEKGVTGFVQAVRDGSFPADTECYAMEADEWNSFQRMIEEEGRSEHD